MNWLDEYIRKNDKGYYISDSKGLFIYAGANFVRHVKGDEDPYNLQEITKDEFIKLLIK